MKQVIIMRLGPAGWFGWPQVGPCLEALAMPALTQCRHGHLT